MKLSTVLKGSLGWIFYILIIYLAITVFRTMDIMNEFDMVMQIVSADYTGEQITIPAGYFILWLLAMKYLIISRPIDLACGDGMKEVKDALFKKIRRGAE